MRVSNGKWQSVSFHSSLFTLHSMEYQTLRAYGKAELAQLYSPGASRASALRLLNKYLHATDGLLDALQRTGYTRGSRHFTRYQVRLIFEYLGEP